MYHIACVNLNVNAAYWLYFSSVELQFVMFISVFHALLLVEMAVVVG